MEGSTSTGSHSGQDGQWDLDDREKAVVGILGPTKTLNIPGCVP